MKLELATITCAVSLSLLLTGGLVPNSRTGLSFVPDVQASSGVSPQIEGTWLLTVTPPPQSGQPPFRVLISFARSGIFLASAEASATGLPAQYGSWTKAGDQYVATALSFGASGVSTFRVRSVFSFIGEDELGGSGDLSICDASGKYCQSFPGCSSLRATRLSVEPPSCVP
jgi:hypothetical protein